MRVIAGSARRQILKTPDGLKTRPTQDRIKETLFNIIQNEVPGSIFCDFCCGGGGIGIEALSRGAVRAYFVENDKDAAACLLENVRKTHFEDRAVILRQDAAAAVSRIHEKHLDIIYIDPPYESTVAEQILRALAVMPYVDADTMIIAETSLTSDMSFLEEIGMRIEREKDYKSQRHLFIRKEDQK